VLCPSTQRPSHSMMVAKRSTGVWGGLDTRNCYIN
jgi:hypothetical protein